MAMRSTHALRPAQPVARNGDVCVGRLVEIRDGHPFVTLYPSCQGRPVVARVAVARTGWDALTPGSSVLIVFEDGDPMRPIIVGIVVDTIAAEPAVPCGSASDSFEIVGRSVTLVGREEVVLRCGEASLALRADGQMTLKGKNLMSRASETNKVRGATVLIN